VVILKNLVLVDWETIEPKRAEMACEYTPFGSWKACCAQPL
jgi:hypothetical protein